MDSPIVNKTVVNEHVLFNVITKEYFDAKNDTNEMNKAIKYHGYSKALRSKNAMSNSNEWTILKIKTTCEIVEIYK